MAVNTNTTNPGTDISASQRMAIGANVTLAVVAALGVLVAANWIASNRKVTVRKDVATAGSYGVSDRTRSVLAECPDKVTLSMLYLPDPEDDKQRGYIDRLTDYLEELKAAAPQTIEWKHVVSDSKRDELVATLNASLGGEAGEHKKTLEAYAKLTDELQAEIHQRIGRIVEISGDDAAWLSNFPVFASVRVVLHQDDENIKKTAEEIKDLVPASGIPKYAEAATKASGQLGELKGHLTGIGDAMSKLAALAAQMTDPAADHAKMFRDLAGQAPGLIAPLRDALGSRDGPPPADIRGALRAYCDKANEVAGQIEPMAKKLDDFEKKNPLVRQHRYWTVPVKMGMIQTNATVADLLIQFGQSLKETRLRVLGAIDSDKSDELAKALTLVRRALSNYEQNMVACQEMLARVADGLSKVDAKSQAVLDECKDNGLFKARLAAITELEDKIKKLPELKLSNVGDRIKEPNSVVIECKNKVRVLSFSDVFPIRDTMGMGNQDEEQRRTFNGDSAISSAVIALSRERPFATVVLTTFEPPAPQQRGPFSPPPPQARIPAQQLTVLKQRLEGANFKVAEWNLATTEESPKPEEGTENVYLVLPPAPASQPSPFGGPPPDEKKFGDAQIEKIRGILNNNGRVLFVAAWDLQQQGMAMFGGGGYVPVPYGYGRLLTEDWGLQIETGNRVCYVVPDAKAPNTYGIDGLKFMFMPASGFSDSELGRPLRGTRFLVNDACPINIAPNPPTGVTLTKILTIPDSETFIAPDIPQLISMVLEIKNPESEGLIKIDAPRHGPFDLAVCAQRKDGDKDKGRIAVLSFGVTLSDFILQQPIPSEKGSRIKFNPAPRECLDLVVNSIYWLQGQSKWISRGPVPTPCVLPIDKGSRPKLNLLVYGVWPVLVFVPGIFLWYIRRR